MKLVKINEVDNILEIKFKSKIWEEFNEIKEFIKNIPNRLFDPSLKLWTVPNLKENRKLLRARGFEFEGHEKGVKEIIVDTSWKELKVNEKLLPERRPYQIDSMRFLQWRNGRALIADDMGTGKTCQALSWACLINIEPILIVVPASVKLQWVREFRKWYSMSSRVELLYGQTPYSLSSKQNYIINWDILTYWQEELEKVNFKYIIGDEIQAISNSKSLRSKSFSKLAKSIPNLVALSGTPIKSKPAQFFPILKLLNPKVFGNQWQFLQRYCDPKNNGFGYTFNGATNLEELHQLVSQVMIRREKKDILKDLPAKQKIVVPLDRVELTNYNKDRKNADFSGSKLAIRETFDHLKTSAFEAKKLQVVKWIEDFISSGEKLVVFGFHRIVVEFLYETFKKQAVLVYGGIKKEDRQNHIDRFINDDSIKLFIGNILAAGAGIDGLQKVCSNSCFVEFAWTPADHNQAEDRLHRIGQTDSVNAYYLIAPGTVDEEIMEVLDNGAKVLESTLNGREIKEYDLLSELLKKYK